MHLRHGETIQPPSDPDAGEIVLGRQGEATLAFGQSLPDPDVAGSLRVPLLLQRAI